MSLSMVLEEGEKPELSTLESAFLTWKWEDVIVVWPFQLFRNRHKTQERHMTTSIPDTSAGDNYYNIVSGL